MEVKKQRVIICTPGYKPVPDVQGGAVEHLTNSLINVNEKKSCFHFLVLSLYDEKIKNITLNNSELYLLKNYQKLLPIRAFFSLFNRAMSWLKKEIRLDYMSIAIPFYAKLISSADDIILVENNLRIFFLCKKLLPKHKVVFHLHNDFDTVDIDLDKTFRRLKKMMKNADGILVASKYLNDRLKMIDSDASVFLLQNCIDRCFFCNSFKKDELYQIKDAYNIKSEFVILFAGRMSEEKGCLQLIQSLRRIEEIDFRLIIAGDSWFGTKSEESYKKKIENEAASMKEKIIKVGYVEPKDLKKLYAISDIVVVPTQCKEAFGMVALEALSMGKCVVASNAGGLMEIVDDTCGRLIDMGPSYVEQLSLSILQLYDDRKKIKDMSKSAEKKAGTFNDPWQYYDEFFDILKKYKK